jgi:hypothetical protein
MHEILATWEVEIGKIIVPDQPGGNKKVHKNPISI